MSISHKLPIWSKSNKLFGCWPTVGEIKNIMAMLDAMEGTKEWKWTKYVEQITSFFFFCWIDFKVIVLVRCLANVLSHFKSIFIFSIVFSSLTSSFYNFLFNKCSLQIWNLIQGPFTQGTKPFTLILSSFFFLRFLSCQSLFVLRQQY